MHGSRIVFVGSGSSTGVPVARCILSNGGDEIACKACDEAYTNGDSRNLRGNPSIIVQHGGKNILIDCGKTFRAGMHRLLRTHRIESIDAVLLTHAHADAILGLDDLREWVFDLDKHIPVYVRDTDYVDIQRVFPYLVDRSKATGSGSVAHLDFITFPAGQPLDIHEVSFMPLALPHGPGCNALGFVFMNVAYLSDLKEVPPAAMDVLHNGGAPLETLIVDSCFIERDISSHFSFIDAMAFIASLRPKKAYLTGMSHDFDYTTLNPLLRQNYANGDSEGEQVSISLPLSGKQYIFPPGIDVEMAYDAMEIPIG